ncbi:hypothetical protein [Pulveribacter sp.]|uniref:hypothetical protein n=1 Tax=Pulveribacter sp. TaxID=2678893 RepID=UPI0028ACF531|nr:hypothetical protein [Pulveribacter sp.]
MAKADISPVIYNEARLARIAAEAAGRPRIWQSGMTVAQGEIVTSPLDWEDYQRITAAGSGSTDPADDVANYLARSYRRVTALPNATAALTNSSSQMLLGSSQTGATLAVDTRTLMLSLSGRGSIRFLGARQPNSQVRSRRLEVFIDGRNVYDATVAYPAAQSYILVAGSAGGGMSGSLFVPAYTALPTADIPFKRSFEAWATTSAGGDSSTSFTLNYMFEPEA